MCVYEVRSPPSLKLDRVDKIQGCVEDGRADVEVSEHPCFTAVKNGLDDVVEEGRPRGDLMNVLNLMFAVDRLSQQWSVPSQPAGCHERRGVALSTWLTGVV